jgi:DNA damage-binding protein 1
VASFACAIILNMQEEKMDGSVTVRDMKLELLGETVVAECICYLDNGYVYIGKKGD